MENKILKNQKQLWENLPTAQLGTKFSKLANRFACRTSFHGILQNSLKNGPLLQNNLLVS